MTTTLTRPSTVRSATLLAWAALVVVWIVWGSTYLAIRVGVETFPPFTMAAIRYVIAGAILLPIGWLSGTPEQRVADRPGRRQWGAMLLLGAMLPAGGNGVVSWAEVKLPSSIAALLVATVPLWMVVADAVLSRRMPGVTRWAALVVGLVGIMILSGVGTSAVPVGATVAVLAAAASWGTGSALQSRLPVPSRAMLMAGMEMFCGGIVCAVVAAFQGNLSFPVGDVSAHSWWALIYLIGPGTLLAMTCYVFVLGKLSPTTVSSYAFVNPVVAVILGALILNERLSGREAVGAAIVVLAVAGLLISRRVRPEPEAGDRPGTDVDTGETVGR